MNDNIDSRALETAIETYFASQNGGAILTGYVLIAKGKSMEDLDREVTRYMVTSPDHMEYDQVLGLTRYGVLNVESGFDEDVD